MLLGFLVGVAVGVVGTFALAQCVLVFGLPKPRGSLTRPFPSADVAKAFRSR